MCVRENCVLGIAPVTQTCTPISSSPPSITSLLRTMTSIHLSSHLSHLYSHFPFVSARCCLFSCYFYSPVGVYIQAVQERSPLPLAFPGLNKKTSNLHWQSIKSNSFPYVTFHWLQSDLKCKCAQF